MGKARDERDRRGFEVRSSRFSELRTSNFELRIASNVSHFQKQIVYALRNGEGGTPVGDLCRQLGVSDATFYAWKKKYAHLGGRTAAAPAAGRRKQPVETVGR